MIVSKLPALKEAVEVYRKEKAAIDQRWDDLTRVDDADKVRAGIARLEQEGKVALEALCLAFYDVTSDINRKENCMLLDADYIIKFAKKHAGA